MGSPINVTFIGNSLALSSPLTPLELSEQIHVPMLTILKAGLRCGVLVRPEQPIDLDVVQQILDALQISDVTPTIEVLQVPSGSQIREQKKLKKRVEEILGRLRHFEAMHRFTTPSLTKDDVALAAKWIQEGTTRVPSNIDTLISDAINGSLKKDKELARVLSARCAEIVAAEFLREHFRNVLDVSIGQLSDGNDQSWKLYDMLADGNPVDVKNARRCYRSHERYVEHCVPRFKLARDNKQISILGVLSPFLYPERILVRDDNRPETLVLGLTTLNDVAELKKSFELPGRFVIPLTIDTGQAQFLPRWLFDYPVTAYRDRDEALRRFAELYASTDLCEVLEEHELQLLRMAAGLDISVDRVNPRDQGFIRKLLQWRRDRVFSLSHVYLSVLTHFIEMCKGPDNTDYQPIHYIKLLYLPKTETEYYSTLPLLIFDPLQSVFELIWTLQALWSEKPDDLREFASFRLHGLNIFQGKKQHDRSWMTIFAYCGNCSYAPLIYGKHTSCNECHRLKCPNCGHCSPNCKSNSEHSDFRAPVWCGDIPF